MYKKGDEIHLDEDEARSGSTPHIVRYVLGISLALAIVLLSTIWMTGALTRSDGEEEAAVAGTQEAREAEPGAGGMVSGEEDEAATAIPNPPTE